MNNDPPTRCHQCELLEEEVVQLRKAVGESVGRQRVVVVSALMVVGMSLLGPLIGWIGSASNSASTSDVWGYMYYGAFFSTTWAVPILIGVLVFAMPGASVANLLHGLMLLATAVSIWRLERLATLDSDLSEWLQRIGPSFAVAVVAYSLAAFAGLRFNSLLEPTTRRSLSVWMLMALTALSALVVRLLQVEEEYGIELLVLCLSTFIACGIQAVLFAMWDRAEGARRWLWLAFSFGMAPLSPALHKEASGERFEYAVFGWTVWAACGLLLAGAIWSMRSWLRRHPPLEPTGAPSLELDLPGTHAP